MNVSSLHHARILVIGAGRLTLIGLGIRIPVNFLLH
jgi:hypothetical protein